MKRELGIVRLALHAVYAQRLQIVMDVVQNGFPDNDSCENKKCSIAKGLTHCYEYEEDCRKAELENQIVEAKKKDIALYQAGKKALLLQKGYCLEILMLIR